MKRSLSSDFPAEATKEEEEEEEEDRARLDALDLLVDKAAFLDDDLETNTRRLGTKARKGSGSSSISCLPLGPTPHNMIS